MSGFVTGIFDILDDVAAHLRQEAEKELEQARNAYVDVQQEYASLQQAYESMLEERRQKESSRMQAESMAAEEALHRTQDSQTRMILAEEEGKSLLAQAEEQVKTLEDSCADKMPLLTRIAAIRESVRILGFTPEALTRIRAFAQDELPKQLMHLYQMREKERLENARQRVFQASGIAQDDSIGFVSLRPHAEVAQSDDLPWTRFANRVKAVMDKQNELGGYGADELWNEMQSIPGEKRNLFMLHNSAHVEAWEREIEALENTLRDAQRQKDSLYRDYLAVYRLTAGRNESGILDIKEHTAAIRAEYDRLMELYLSAKKEEYLEASIRRVFEAHGFQFESVASKGKDTLEISFSMDEDSGVRVCGSNSGAFELTFLGKTDSEEVSEDQKRRIVERAETFCTVLPSITRELRELGIVFDQRAAVAPMEENIQIVHVQSGYKNYAPKSRAQA